MPFDLLNILQTLLLPLALGAVVACGLLVYLAGRKQPRRQAPPPARAEGPASARTAPAATSRTAAPAPAPATPVTPAASAPAPCTPAAIDPAPTPPRPAPAAPALPLVADLLLVDDSAVVRAKLRRLFEPAGYRVALAQDGEAALALLGQGRYSLLVTDLEMPRLDGVGLIRATLADPRCAAMPILAITGHDNLQSQLNQLNAVAGIYRKPWLDDDLLGHVQALVAPSLLPADAVLES